MCLRTESNTAAAHAATLSKQAAEPPKTPEDLNNTYEVNNTIAHKYEVNKIIAHNTRAACKRKRRRRRQGGGGQGRA